MGLRFQKRIKLGKGLGVTMSKSGLSPNFRTKAGSLSSRGISIRTGIPGLTFRKSLSGFSGKGCLVALSFFLTLGGCIAIGIIRVIF
ncbi:DUF4236 domain-containing protein [Sinomicrobium oceani]|uniref:DUF4236 domain-containing protein n=1 Tax=Sinomicrobium oceani TaxID=1150368 RepID=UPI00227AD86F|nr:DUF4236 domain-containing protein [Sinomicrobium oceani]